MNRVELIEHAIYDELPYRRELRINKPFGLEIEAALSDALDRYYIVNDDLAKKDYKRNIDKTVGGSFPLEINTPLLCDDVQTWSDLYKLSKRLEECDVNFDTAAFQVNIDIEYDYLDCYYLLLLFRTFEHIIFKFSTSGCASLRPLKYAQSVGLFLRDFNKREIGRMGIDKLINSKNFAFSLNYNSKSPYGSPPNIFEARIPNGCSDAWMWQNYVNMFYYLTESIHGLDLDYINYSLLYGEEKEKNYLDLDIDDALKFSDIIFNNDEDKAYFLKQYIGPSQKDAKMYLKGVRRNYGIKY